MAATFASNNLETSSSSHDSSRKKRRKLDDDVNPIPAATQLRWRSENEQRIYTSKLIHALQNARRETPTSSSPAGNYSGVKAVKETADRVLAISAKGTTRWSRAIRTSRVKRLQRSKKKKVTGSGSSRLRMRRTMPEVERKVKVLGRLVPGCRKAPLTNLLEETSDYIAALEMQVRTMTALTDLLSGNGGGSPPVS